MEDKLFVPRQVSAEDSLTLAKTAIEILDIKKAKNNSYNWKCSSAICCGIFYYSD